MNRFDQVIMHFLVVGHTHCVIDQYFSVISRKIYTAEFIATPHALHALILQPKVTMETTTVVIQL